MKIQSLFVFGALVFVAGCHGDGSGYVPTPPPKITPAVVKPGEESTLFPLAVGNQWTYSVETALQNNGVERRGKRDVTFKIAHIEDTPNGKKAEIEVSDKDQLQDKQVWLFNDKGIYKVSAGIKTVTVYTPPAPIILFPLDSHKTFNWTGTGGKVKRTSSSEILPVQEVDTDEKRMSAIPVQTKGTNTEGKVTQKTDETNWFVPGVGLVRNRLSTSSPKAAAEVVLKLKSHTLK